MDSPENQKKIAMFSKQSPHFTQIEITKTSVLRADDFKEKTKIHCQFCGGKTCKHENWMRCTNPAIKGLNSNWINENIIASQRLSDRLIQEYDIIQQFKEKGVNAVFNLQEPGEHPYCGDGIKMRSGFSYTPEVLMNNGISFFNFFWKDLTNPTFERCLNTAQVMDYIIQNGGKCLVHCHAGQGRTALVIGAYLIISGTAKDDKEAIMLTRKNRPQCFRKSYNQKYIKGFYEKFMDLKKLFPTQSQKQSLKEILNKQGLLFHGEERKYTKFIPKIISLVLQQVKSLASKKQMTSLNEVKLQFTSPQDQNVNEVEQIRKRLNRSEWAAINECKDTKILTLIAIEFIRNLQNYIIERRHIDQMEDNYKKLDSYVLGFLTAIADLSQVLTQDTDDSIQTDEIYELFTNLIIQGQTYFKDTVLIVLKELSTSKNQIYQSEEIKESNEISPIKQIIQDSNTLKSIFYDDKAEEQQQQITDKSTVKDEDTTISRAQFTIELRDPQIKNTIHQDLFIKQKSKQKSERIEIDSQDGPVPVTREESSNGMVSDINSLPNIHQKYY